MPGIRVGGVSVNFSVNTKPAEGQLNKFIRHMDQIKLGGIIKGDPFSAVRDYMKAAKNELNSVFESWIGNTEKADNKFGTFAEKARKNVEKIITEFKKLDELDTALKFKSMKPISLDTAAERTKLAPISKQKGESRKAAFDHMTSKDEFKKYIKEYEEYGGRVEEISKEIQKKLKTEEGITEKDLKKHFKEMNEIIKAGGKEAEKVYKQFGETLASALKKQAALEQGQAVRSAKDVNEARKKRIDLTKQLRIKELELIRDAKAGIGTDQLKANLAKLYIKWGEKGAVITTKRADAIRRYNKSVALANRGDKVRIAHQKEVTKSEKEAARISEELAKEEEKRNKEQSRLDAERLKERQKFYEYQAKIQKKSYDKPRVASATTIDNEIFAKQAKFMIDTRKQIRLSVAALEKGFNIEKNREAILAKINQLKTAGVKLTKDEVNLEKLINKQKRTFKQDTVYQQELKNAKSVKQARLKRIKLTKELRIEEARLRAEAKAGINVEKLRANIMKVRAKYQELGAKLTKKQTAELKEYTRQAEKAAKIKQIDGGFMSKKWIKERLVWFLQLRLFWSVYRRAGDAAESLIKYEVQLSRALRTASSDMQTRTQLVENYGIAMKGALQAHGVDWEGPGEALYQLGSAGLSAEEALAGLNSTLSLIVGTEGDVAETTKSVAGVYNNFKDTLTELISPQEKLVYINDLMAAAWKKHQVEISELTDGYRRASAAARVVGVSLKDLTALLAVSNDHMIKGGVAGRALTAVWSRASRDVDKFKDVFQLDIDPTKPLKFMEIMKQLSERFKQGVLSADQLGDMFKRLGLRGAPVFATLLKNWKDVEEAQRDFNDVTGEAARLEEERLNNLDGQWKKFLGRLKSYVAGAKGLLEIGADLLRNINAGLDYFLGHSVANVDRQTAEMVKLIKKRRERIAELEEHQRIQGSLPGVYDLDQLKEDLKNSEDALKRLIALRAELTGQVAVTISNHERRRLEAKKEKEEVQALASGYKFLAQEEFYRLRQTDNLGKKLIKALSDEAKQIDKVDKALKRARKSQTSQGWEIAVEQQKILVKLTKDRVAAEQEIEKITKKEMLDNLNLTKQQMQSKKAVDKAAIDRLKVGGLTRDEQAEMKKLLDDQYQSQVRINNLEYEKSVRSSVNTANAEETTELARIQLDLADEQALKEKENGYALADRLALQKELADIAADYEERLDTQKHEIELSKIFHANKLSILKLEEKSLYTQRESYKAQLEAVDKSGTSEENNKRIASLKNKIRDIDLEILRTEEDITRQSSIQYDWIQRIKDGLKEWHDVATDALVQFTEGFAVGTGGLLTDLTGGFQEQQQEVADLRVELGGLQKELDEAIDEGDVEKVNQINAQMAELHSQIDDLEDPIHNLKEGFKDFFKSLIDDIRRAISEWIAMQVVMGIVSAFSPAMSSNITANPMSGPQWNQIVAGTGGVLPNIKAFRSFSTGGMTNRPTLALLGDNKSKQELVIPTENIQPNSVSGYMRNSDQPVNVINILSKEDIYAIMSEAEGQRVIINPIGKDLREGGPLSKMMRV